MKTRMDYLNNVCTHREYYAQFVTHETLEYVKRHIGLRKLLASKDQHFNDIPLKSWDFLTEGLFVFEKKWIEPLLRACRDYPTLAGGVCILKEAAEQIRESEDL